MMLHLPTLPTWDRMMHSIFMMLSRSSIYSNKERRLSTESSPDNRVHTLAGLGLRIQV